MSEPIPQDQVEEEDTRPLWTVRDVARYLSLTPATIRAMARRGELPCMKMGKAWRFYQSSVIEHFESKK